MQQATAQPQADDGATLLDRRRPGRGLVEAALPCDPAAAPRTEGDFGQGLSYGVLLSIPLWAALVEVIRLAVR